MSNVITFAPKPKPVKPGRVIGLSISDQVSTQEQLTPAKPKLTVVK
jgi:hypothetical protein